MKLTVDAEGEGKRLDRYLAERLEDVSRANVMKYLKEGRARVNGRKTRAGVALAKGDEWRELLIPFVQSVPGVQTLATIWPPGHMQKLWAAGRLLCAFDTSP